MSPGSHQVKVDQNLINVARATCIMINALWHIDGYHKLIRWRLVIHGGIDGYSRVPVYLKVASDNKAVTVFNAFLQAVELFGQPSCVRLDRGGENFLVGRFMLEHSERGPREEVTFVVEVSTTKE